METNTRTTTETALLNNPRTQRAFATAKSSIKMYGALSTIALVAVIAVSSSGHMVNTFMWVRAALLPAGAVLIYRMTVSASRGSRRTFERVNALAVIMPIAFITRGSALRAAFPKGRGDVTAMTHAAASAGGEQAGGRPRLWFVDNLRVALTCLVIVHHVVVTYSGVGLWYYTEKPSSASVGLGLTVFLMVNQAWFMGAFFLLSGYFTPGSYQRKGPRAFLRDRMIRLGTPLVVFYFILNPILTLAAHHSGSSLRDYWAAIGSGPLWFLLVLLILDTAYALAQHLTRRRPGREVAQARPPAYWMVAALVGALALVTYLWRIVVPIGFWIPIADLPTGAYLPQYIAFFALGIVAHRRGWFAAITTRMGLFGLALAAGATLIFLPLALANAGAFTGAGTVNSLCYTLWDSSIAVGVCLALLAFFRRGLNRTGPLRSYLANHTFAVYVTHAFVVTATGSALSLAALPTLAKVALALIVALPACFALAGPVRHLPGMRRML